MPVDRLVAVGSCMLAVFYVWWGEANNKKQWKNHGNRSEEQPLHPARFGLKVRFGTGKGRWIQSVEPTQKGQTPWPWTVTGIGNQGNRPSNQKRHYWLPNYYKGKWTPKKGQTPVFRTCELCGCLRNKLNSLLCGQDTCEPPTPRN